MKSSSQSLLVLLFVSLIPMNAHAANALRFTRAQNDRCLIEDSESLDIDGQTITMEAWIRLPEPNMNGEMTILNKENSYEIKVGNGLFQVAIWTANWAWLGDNSPVQANRWYHAAATYDGQNIRVYLDGQLRSTHAKQGNIHTSDSSLVLGSRPLQNFIHCYNGDLDEVRVWNVARSVEQLRATMNVALSGDEEGLVGYWRLDEGEGQTIRDLTGNGNDGILGATDDEENTDPTWFESDAPIHGGILEITPTDLHFPPTAVGRSRELKVLLRNLAEEQDELFGIDFELTFPDGDRPAWLTADVMEGHINAREQQEISFTINTQDIQPSDYQTLAHLTTNSINLLQMNIPVDVTVVEGEGSVAGTVIDPATRRPVEGAIVRMAAEYSLSDTTNEDGAYEFDQLPAYNYLFQITKLDYLPLLSDTITLEPNQNIERNFALLHSEFTPSVGAIDASLPFEDAYEYPLTVTNTGNGLLTWAVERVFPEGHVAEPWALRQTFDASASLEDDRIEGVAFDGDNFYLAGAAGADSSQIYVVNRDGELVRSFDQLTHTRYGMKDLEWDGELLWGSGESVVYGFNTEGDSIISFNGPFNPTNNIAYDPDAGLLWFSGTTTNIAAYDRQGNATGQVLNRKGLRIYGLAYWPEDPDGYNLYIFNTPAAGVQLVHKMNVANGDTMLARSIPVENGESPTGAYICNDYDPYAWVMVTMQNRAPADGGDRLAIWQLGARTDWVQVSPLQDVIAAGESDEVTVSFNSAGMPEDLRMEATLRFTHDGIGSMTEIPVAMNVTGEGGLTQRLMRFSRGWNLVSVNIDVAGAENFDSLLTPLVDAGLLVLAKDARGNFYWPARGFNGIESWSGYQSYWLKLLNEAELRLSGTSIAYDHEIPLHAGWNGVSYLPRQPVEASIALGGLGENLMIARDGAGRFYLPAYGFSDIGTMREGLGYQLHVREDASLVYQLAGRAASLTNRYNQAELAWLEEVTRTDLQHNLLVKSDLAAGTRLEALTSSGLIAGRGVVGVDGMAGLTLWGDDPSTPVVEGFLEGEEATINEERRTKNVEPLNSQLSTLNFTAGGWGVIELTGSSVPVSFGLTETYPNPFNGELRVTFSLIESGKTLLRAFDLTGREVGIIVSGNLEAGQHRVVWQATDIPTGLYMLRLESAGRNSCVKVLLMK